MASVSGVASTAPDSKFHVLLSDAAQCYEEHNVLTLDEAQPKLLALYADSADGVARAVDAARSPPRRRTPPLPLLSTHRAEPPPTPIGGDSHQLVATSLGSRGQGTMPWATRLAKAGAAGAAARVDSRARPGDV